MRLPQVNASDVLMEITSRAWWFEVPNCVDALKEMNACGLIETQVRPVPLIFSQ